MTPASPLLRHFSHPRLLLAFTVALAIVITAGCGSDNSSTKPVLSGNTEVTLLLSSTANDEVSQFDVDFNSAMIPKERGNKNFLARPHVIKVVNI